MAPLAPASDLRDLFGRLAPTRGLDYTRGRQLFQMVLDANFSELEATFKQPVVARVKGKRLLEWSVAEVGPVLLAAGLVTDRIWIAC